MRRATHRKTSSCARRSGVAGSTSAMTSRGRHGSCHFAQDDTWCARSGDSA